MFPTGKVDRDCILLTFPFVKFRNPWTHAILAIRRVCWDPLQTRKDTRKMRVHFIYPCSIAA
jgi:hypothetical protein